MTKRKQDLISKYFNTKELNETIKECKETCDNNILANNECAKNEDQWLDITGPQLSLSSLMLYRKVEERKYIFNELERQITYFSDPKLTRITVFGRCYDLPRKQAAYGNDGVTYTYSGIKIAARPWTDAVILQQILRDIKKATNIDYNFVLVNRYQDGRNKMGEHKDDEKELDQDVPIASLSFGQERDFIFRHQDLVRKVNNGLAPDNGKKLNKIVLKDGMLLLMNPPTNQFWYHSLPRRSIRTCPDVRINMTFRKII